jgi:hypothetical protein
MKKLLSIFIALALFTTPMSAVAAVKAGDVCKKAGSIAKRRDCSLRRY